MGTQLLSYSLQTKKCDLPVTRQMKKPPFSGGRHPMIRRYRIHETERCHATFLKPEMSMKMCSFNSFRKPAKCPDLRR
jgi:hypothetical protein